MEQYSQINTYMKAVLACLLTLSVIYICIVRQNLEPLIGLAGTAIGYYFGKQSQAPQSIDNGSIKPTPTINNEPKDSIGE